MRKLKEVLTKIIFPPVLLVAFLIPISALLLIYAFVSRENADTVLIYASYILSAYTLTVVCARIPSLFQKAKAVKRENKYLNRYATDAGLRIKISLYTSLTINILYAVMQLYLGFYNRSIWFYALFGYYALLALMRFFLLKETRKNRLGKNILWEFFRYRTCGILLILMNITITVIASYIVWQNRGFEYHYILTIAMAAYTFFTLTIAIINIIRYRKYANPIMSAAKAISLAAALVSMLSLETAMLTAFGKEANPALRQQMTAYTSAAVCTLILAIAIYMIIHSTKMIKQLRQGVKTNEQ